MVQNKCDERSDRATNWRIIIGNMFAFALTISDKIVCMCKAFRSSQCVANIKSAILIKSLYRMTKTVYVLFSHTFYSYRVKLNKRERSECAYTFIQRWNKTKQQTNIMHSVGKQLMRSRWIFHILHYYNSSTFWVWMHLDLSNATHQHQQK